jgi:4-hydroxybenzoate polyprenyltransferase
MSLVSDAWRILLDSASYRIRRREAANLLASTTLATALGLAVPEIGYRFVFGAVLNAFVYLLNDCCDVRIDLRAPSRDGARTRFLADHALTGWWLTAFLAVLLTAMGSLHSAGLVVAFVSTAGIILAYSMWLKGHAGFDIFAMILWGLSMALVGFPIDSKVGWRFAGLLALLSGVTEVVQVLRDEPTDRAAGVRTTAVTWGPPRTALVARGLVLAAAVYAFLFLHRTIAALLLPALFVPLAPDRAVRAWDALRITFGLAWAALLAAYFRAGRLDGWWPG